VGKAIVVLTKIILSVELQVHIISSDCNDRGSSSHGVGLRHVVAIVGSIGEVGVVHLWRHHGVLGVGSSNRRQGSRWGGNSNSNRSSGRGSDRCDDRYSDRGSSGHSDRGIHMVDGKVGGGHTEAHGVRDVVHSLDNTIGINIAVAPPGHSIGGLHLLLDRVRVAVAVAVLAEIVLGVVLGVLSHRSSMDHRGSNGGGHIVNLLDGHRGSHRGGHIVDLLGRLCHMGDWGNCWGGEDHRVSHRRWCHCRSVVQGEVLGLDCSSSLSLAHSDGVSLLGSSHLWGVHHRHREGHGTLGQVGSCHAEPSSVSDVLNSLEDAVGVNIPVGSAHHTVGGLHLLPHRVGVVVAKAVLAEVVLGVVLGSSDVLSNCHRGGNHHRSNRSSHRGGLDVLGRLNHSSGCSVHVLGRLDMVVVLLSIGKVGVVD